MFAGLSEPWLEHRQDGALRTYSFQVSPVLKALLMAGVLSGKELSSCALAFVRLSKIVFMGIHLGLHYSKTSLIEAVQSAEHVHPEIGCPKCVYFFELVLKAETPASSWLSAAEPLGNHSAS